MQLETDKNNPKVKKIECISDKFRCILVNFRGFDSILLIFKVSMVFL